MSTVLCRTVECWEFTTAMLLQRAKLSGCGVDAQGHRFWRSGCEYHLTLLADTIEALGAFAVLRVRRAAFRILADARAVIGEAGNRFFFGDFRTDAVNIELGALPKRA